MGVALRPAPRYRLGMTRRHARATAEIRGALRRARARASPPTPLEVRRRLLATGERGDCGLVGRGRQRRFSIRLHSNLRGEALLETLAHELAHAATWRVQESDHGPAWGRAYARFYRILIAGEER